MWPEHWHCDATIATDTCLQAETDDVHAVVVSGRGRPGSTPEKRVFCAGMAMDASMLEGRGEGEAQAEDPDTSNLAG